MNLNFCPNQAENLKISQQWSNKSFSYVITIDAKLFSTDDFLMEQICHLNVIYHHLPGYKTCYLRSMISHKQKMLTANAKENLQCFYVMFLLHKNRSAEPNIFIKTFTCNT